MIVSEKILITFFSSIGNNSAPNTIWVDDDDTGKWILLKNKQVFELKPNIVNTTAGLLDSQKKILVVHLA